MRSGKHAAKALRRHIFLKDRVQEAAQVRQWNAANVMKVQKHHVKKRTVHTVRRHRSIRSAGVKIAPKRNPMRA